MSNDELFEKAQEIVRLIEPLDSHKQIAALEIARTLNALKRATDALIRPRLPSKVKSWGELARLTREKAKRIESAADAFERHEREGELFIGESLKDVTV